MEQDHIELAIWTRANLSDPELALRTLQTLSSVGGGAIAPEYFSRFEPINRSLVEEGIAAAVSEWSGQGPRMGTFQLRRRSSPKYGLRVDWAHPRLLDEKPAPWFVIGSFYSVKKSQGAELLLRALLESIPSEYGDVTLHSIQQSIHRFRIHEKHGFRDAYVGTQPGDTIPHISWLTYLGPWAIKKIGQEKLESLPAGQIERLAGGYLIRTAPELRDVVSPKGQMCIQKIVAHLGRSHFFDREMVDIQSLETPQQLKDAYDRAARQILEEGSTSGTFEVNPDGTIKRVK